MSNAQFDFTDRLVDLLKPAIEAAGLDHIDVVVNPDDDGFGDDVDDSVEFRLKDGAETPFYIQVGLYGIGTHELIYNDDGSVHGSKPYPTFSVTDIDGAVADAIERIRAIPVPAPSPHP